MGGKSKQQKEQKNQQSQRQGNLTSKKEEQQQKKPENPFTTKPKKEVIEKVAAAGSDGPSLFFDSFWLALLYGALTWRNSMYPQQMYDFYSGKVLPGYFANFFTFMRVYLTRMGNGHFPFPLWRNIAFNVIREAFIFTYPKVIFEWDTCGFHHVEEFMYNNLIQVIIFTIVFQYIPMTFQYRIKYLYHYLRAEYFMGFPLGGVDFINLLTHENHYRGDLLILLVVCLIQLNDRTAFEMLEDKIFGDMGMFHVGQTAPYIGYFLPLLILTYQLMYVEKWDLYFDFWPEYDHCKSPVSLIMKNQCRPRVYGFKEIISYNNKRHHYHFIYFTVILELVIYIQTVQELRMFRKQEISHKAVTAWKSKVKKD